MTVLLAVMMLSGVGPVEAARPAGVVSWDLVAADTGKAKPQPRPAPPLNRAKPTVERGKTASRPQPTGDPKLKRRKPPGLSSRRIG